MDLNHVYSQHQIALIRAAAASDAPARVPHLAEAARLAGRIAGFRRHMGADASHAWGDHCLTDETINVAWGSPAEASRS